MNFSLKSLFITTALLISANLPFIVHSSPKEDTGGGIVVDNGGDLAEFSFKVDFMRYLVYKLSPTLEENTEEYKKLVLLTSKVLRAKARRIDTKDSCFQQNAKDYSFKLNSPNKNNCTPIFKKDSRGEFLFYVPVGWLAFETGPRESDPDIWGHLKKISSAKNALFKKLISQMQ